MRLRGVGEEYESTVGALHRYRVAADGNQPGDPARAAEVIVGIVGLEEPPLRLPLGSDALQAAVESAGSRGREVEAWAEISRSTDYA